MNDSKAIKNDTTKLSEIEVKSSISINFTKTGILICHASNEFGISTKKLTILLTGIT